MKTIFEKYPEPIFPGQLLSKDLPMVMMWFTLLFVSPVGLAQNVGIGTTAPEARLHVHSVETPQLIISGAEGAYRPGIQFKNNNIHYISGDDLSDESFGFYSKFSSQRTYGASVHVYGPAAASWGTFVGLKHDGARGTLYTDVGDLILLKGTNGRFGIGTELPQRLVTIDGGTAGSEIQLVNTASGKTVNDGVTVGIIPSQAHAAFWNYENADMFFGTNNTRYLTIKADGKIGMGINSPAAGLHVQYNSSTTVPGLLLTEPEADDARIMFKNTTQPSKHWLVQAGINASDPLSKLGFTYYNGVNTAQELFAFTAAGELNTSKTGAAHMLPVAYGMINGNGTMGNSGTGNWSVQLLEPGTDFVQYKLTLNGITVSYAECILLITPINASSIPSSVVTSGSYFIFIESLQSGKQVQASFYFMVYKK